jgi:hypothetical protein
MDNIEAYPCGTSVEIKILKMEAMITCVAIRFDKVNYELSYFSNGEERLIWLNEKQFTTQSNKEVIGFRK